MKGIRQLTALAALMLTAGCGTGDPESNVNGQTGSDGRSGLGSNYFPWKVGNTWFYEVRELGHAPYEKTHTIENMEAVGGTGPNASKMAYKVVTKKVGGAARLPDQTISWQAPDGSKIVRYRETSYRAGTDMVDMEEHWMPYKLRFDEKPMGMAMRKGMSWAQSYTEVKIDMLGAQAGMMATQDHVDTWTVAAVGVDITVKAGAFKSCVEVKKTGGAAEDVGKSYVFCPNVGKVKEVGRFDIVFRASPTEELTKYDLK
jgi:hypothetical protein